MNLTYNFHYIQSIWVGSCIFLHKDVFNIYLDNTKCSPAIIDMLCDAIGEKHNKRRMDGPILDHFNWDHPEWDVTMEDEANGIKGTTYMDQMREVLISDLRFTEWGVRKKDETKFYFKSGVFTDEE